MNLQVQTGGVDMWLIFFIIPPPPPPPPPPPSARIDRYIPGIALLLAFHEEHHANPIKELSASVVAASADSIDVSLKFPKVRLENTLPIKQFKSNGIWYLCGLHVFVCVFFVLSTVHSVPPGDTHTIHSGRLSGC